MVNFIELVSRIIWIMVELIWLFFDEPIFFQYNFHEIPLISSSLLSFFFHVAENDTNFSLGKKEKLFKSKKKKNWGALRLCWLNFSGVVLSGFDRYGYGWKAVGETVTSNIWPISTLIGFWFQSSPLVTWTLHLSASSNQLCDHLPHVDAPLRLQCGFFQRL